MAAKIPLKANYTGLDVTSLGEFETGDTIDNAYLTNPKITIGTTDVALGATQYSLTTLTNLGYTGTLTGGTGVIAIGTNQIYKDASGNVGIGRTPSYTLDVAGSVMRLVSPDSTAQLFLTDSGTTNGYVRLQSESNAMKIITGNSISAVIDASGNLGIGTSSPAAKLDVVNSATYQLRVASATGNYADAGIYLGSLGTSDPYYYGTVRYVQSTETTNISNNSASLGKGGISFLIGRGTPGTPSQVALLDASGNLGLGVTPKEWNNGYRALQIGPAASIATYNGTGSDVRIYCNAYLNAAAGDPTYIQSSLGAGHFQIANDEFRWWSAAGGTAGNTFSFTRKMTLDASGNLDVPANIKTRSSFQVNNTPSISWGIDCALSAAADNCITIAASGTYDLSTGSGFVILHSNTDGTAAAFLCYAGVIAKLGGSSDIVSGPPAANQIGFFYNAGTGKYRIQNGYSSSQSVFITAIKTRKET